MGDVRRLRRGIIGCASLLAVASLSAIGITLWQLSDVAQASVLSVANNDGIRDVAIVPGARVWRNQPGSILLQRLDVALALYRAHRVRAVLVSGNEGASE